MVCDAPRRLRERESPRRNRRSMWPIRLHIRFDDGRGSASPIVLAGGSRVEADISLHAVPALHLRWRRRARPDGSYARSALTQYIFGTEVPMVAGVWSSGIAAKMCALGIPQMSA